MNNVVNFMTAEQKTKEEIKASICEHIDKGDYVIMIAHSRESDHTVVETSFDPDKYRVFAKGLLVEGSDAILHHNWFGSGVVKD